MIICSLAPTNKIICKNLHLDLIISYLNQYIKKGNVHKQHKQNE